jgi:hypothetical protein
MESNEYDTRLEIRGIGRLQFFVESFAQWCMLFIAMILMMGGTAWMTAVPSNPMMVEETVMAGGLSALIGMALVFVAWVWSLFTWYRRLVNMGYGMGVFLLVILVVYLTAGIIGIFLWFWLLFAPSKPQIVYVKKKSEEY